MTDPSGVLARKYILADKLKRYLDLNTDFGQSDEAHLFEPADQSLLVYVSSVNIPACVHDGEPEAVSRAITTAREFGCTIGAHVAYPDPAHRGRKPMDLSPDALRAWLLVQLGAFQALCKAQDASMAHVRPHGALYGALMHDEATARIVAETVYAIDPWLMLVGPAGPLLSRLQEEIGVRISPEVCIGKRYGEDGYPVLDRFEDPLPHQGVMAQARQLILESAMTTVDGSVRPIQYKSIHISPRLENAMPLAEKLVTVLGQAVPHTIAAVGASGWAT